MDLDWWQIWDSVYHLGIAFLLVVPMALNRERHARSAGLRTFPLVAVASCGFMIVGLRSFAEPEAQARVAYGIVTGIGFIGGGAILKRGSTVAGTATAASIWNTGAIGLAVAYSRYEVALVLALVNFLVLAFGPTVKSEVPAGDDEEA